ncbi:MAG: peptidylprolyl isomerase, partial [Acidobacteria bacterium]
MLPFFATRAVETLITEKAAVAEAQRMGLKATDAELQDELQHGQLAQYIFPGGNFIGQDEYDNFVQRNFEMTIPQFEERLKEDILKRKLQALVFGSANVTEAALRQEFERKNTKVKFEYAVLSQDDIRRGIHPSEDELKAFYERNKNTYNNSIPEQRKVKYVLIDIPKLEAETPVTARDLQT